MPTNFAVYPHRTTFQADRHLGLSTAVARARDDPRRLASCTHDLPSLVRQRLYGLALGYEDLNDHQSLRLDLALQTAVERDTPLASASPLCRSENQANRSAAVRLHGVLIEQFIASFRRATKRLILDFDATDDAVHGQQAGRRRHGRSAQWHASRDAARGQKLRHPGPH